MIINSIKPHKIPDRLIYTKGDTSQIFSTKTGVVFGYIKTKKTILKDKSFYPNCQGANSLYIKYIEVVQYMRNKGIGSELINFAHNLSKKLGAEGRLHGVAWNFEHPGNPPHKFYRKLGFTTANPSINRAIDFAIEHDFPIPPKLTQGTPMYLENYKRNKITQ